MRRPRGSVGLVLVLGCLIAGCSKQAPPPPTVYMPPPGVYVPQPPAQHVQPSVDRVVVEQPIVSASSLGHWRLRVKIALASDPPTSHVPMVLRLTPERQHQPIHINMDVGFAGASGKLHRVCKFRASLHADRGFAPGPYLLQVLHASGAPVGTPVRVELR